MRTSRLRPLAFAVLLTAGVYAQSVAPPRDPGNWPSFRGAQGSGVSSSAQPPVTWNLTSSTNVAWRTPIPGLAHSSPIVWGNRVYLTTAIGQGAAAQSVALGDSDRAGIDPATDTVSHQWQLLALD